MAYSYVDSSGLIRDVLGIEDVEWIPIPPPPGAVGWSGIVADIGNGVSITATQQTNGGSTAYATVDLKDPDNRFIYRTQYTQAVAYEFDPHTERDAWLNMRKNTFAQVRTAALKDAVRFARFAQSWRQTEPECSSCGREYDSYQGCTYCG